MDHAVPVQMEKYTYFAGGDFRSIVCSHKELLCVLNRDHGRFLRFEIESKRCQKETRPRRTSKKPQRRIPPNEAINSKSQ